jgi:hypothetical protein
MSNLSFILFHPGDLGNVLFVYLFVAIIAFVFVIGLIIFLLIKLGNWLNRRNERNLINLRKCIFIVGIW